MLFSTTSTTLSVGGVALLVFMVGDVPQPDNKRRANAKVKRIFSLFIKLTYINYFDILMYNKSWRVRLVADGAALERRLGASPREFESPTLRHTKTVFAVFFIFCHLPPNQLYYPRRPQSDRARHPRLQLFPNRVPWCPL